MFNTVKINQSIEIKGVNESGNEYLGIPFAELSKTKHRWQPLQISEIRTQKYDNFATIAPQLPSTLDPYTQREHQPLQSENCLNLNIFTPKTDAKDLPVMVWIHGGGFAIGHGSHPAYHGADLAAKGNVIVVTINYRLGALGFLRLCDVTDGLIPATGNEGLFDQITALRWVQKNISLFGGNPDNVTIFGESAGAMSICHLLAMPKAKGLFHKAIMQSGGGHSYHSVEKANRVARQFLNSAEVLGFCPEQLLELATTDILAIQQHFTSRKENFLEFGILTMKPVIDGLHLTAPPYQAIANGSAKDISIIAGSNSDEWTFFAAMSKDKVDTIEELYPRLAYLFGKQNLVSAITLFSQQLTSRDIDTTPQNILNEALTEFWFTEPCRRILDAQTQAGGTAFGYRLEKSTVIPAMGCTHTADIGYVFNTLNDQFHGSEQRVTELKSQIQQSWSHFAHAGTPTNESLVWPEYNQSMMCFGEQKNSITEQSKASRLLWSTITDQALAAF